MTEHENETESNETGPGGRAVSRRRLLKTLGGAATVGAGAMLVGQAAPAGASTDNGVFSSDTATPAVSAVSTGAGAGVSAISKALSGGIGVSGRSYSDNGYGVRGANFGDGSAIGVAGVSFSDSGRGVQGSCSAPTGYGVVGLNLATSGTAPGVHGESASTDGSAVEGINTATTGGAVGVFGQSSSPGGSAVEGFNNATSGDADGVYGQYSSPAGHGVEGFNSATSGFAVAVQGVSSSSDGFGVVGINTAKSGRSVGVYGETGNTDTGIGVLSKGKLATTSVIISGFSFLGATRSLYSMASPECWLEDFGSAQLVDGAADVVLDPGFSAAVRTDSYNVFVVPEGDCRGLYVAAKGEQGFTVRELQGGMATVPFSYRVVSRRQDVDAPRLAEVDLSPLASRTRNRAPRVARKALLA
jgi:hypothetical protein